MGVTTTVFSTSFQIVFMYYFYNKAVNDKNGDNKLSTSYKTRLTDYICGTSQWEMSASRTAGSLLYRPTKNLLRGRAVSV